MSECEAPLSSNGRQGCMRSEKLAHRYAHGAGAGLQMVSRVATGVLALSLLAERFMPLRWSCVLHAMRGVCDEEPVP